MELHNSVHSPSRLGAQRRQKASLIRIPFRGHAESDQADSLHARGPSTNLSGLSGFRSELHARHELQEAVSARKKANTSTSTSTVIRLEWLFDGAFEASHESSCLRSDCSLSAVKAYAALACSSSHCFRTAFDMPAFSKLNFSPYLRRAVAIRTSLAAT